MYTGALTQVGMSTMVRVGESTHEALKRLQREGESLDDVIARLLAERREAVAEGAGFWRGSDAAERARDARSGMAEALDRDR